MAELERRIAELPADELRQLLGRLKERRGDEADGIVPRPRRPGGDPLSFAQRRMWFLDHLQPGNPAYNVAGAVRMQGRLDAAALSAALAHVVRRHEVLHSRFPLRDGTPVQEVVEPPPHGLPLIDLSALPAERRSPLAERWCRWLARRSFDLAAGCLLRSLLLRLGEERYRLALVFHHIVGDAWSTGVLTAEVARLYAAYAAGETPRPSPPPVQYADCALHERRRLRGETLERKVEHWRRRLDALPVLDLPTDRPRPPVRSLRGARAPLRLPPELARQVRRLAGSRGATPFLVLLAAFAALLHRYGGQDDLAVGAPVANRERPEVQGLVGCFANTLVLRADLAGDPSFGRLLERLRAVAGDAFSHQDLPFEKLVEELAPERSRSHDPLVQALFAFQDEAPRFELPGLELELEDVANGSAKLDLLLHLVGEGGDGGYDGYLEYSTDLFAATTARRLAGSYRRLLESALAAPETPLSRLTVMAPWQRSQLWLEWNDTAAMPAPTTLHALVAAQAERTPEAVAVDGAGETLTYRELVADARRLARRLATLGVGPEVRVALCARRTPRLVVAVLAVLDAGGAYVPLDPEYPADRLAFMLRDSAAAVLLTDGAADERLPAVEVPRLDLGAAAEGGDGPPSAAAGPENLAYLIYTSGSTGRPKGVAIPHAAAAALVRWAGGRFAGDELAAVLASTSICFDLSIFELFVPLAHGGRVVLAADAVALAGPRGGGVTLLNTVPSAADELVRAGALPASLRTINLAGEPLRRELVERLAEAVPGVRILNLYGPSEDTTYSTWAPAVPGETTEPTIGRPIAGSRAYLLDRRLRPAPLGAVGELCLAGRGLARGYLGRPALTAERFVPDPFAALAGAVGSRLYRTGDLARWRGDGELEFLGRLDHQVKLRGFRIELGEIEVRLGEHPAVREAVVVVRRSAAGEGLVAYYTLEDDAEAPAGTELRQALARHLPDYMLPAHLVHLEEMPRTPNGKVDRSALPAPELRGAGGAAPRTPTEELVAAVWSELLGVDEVTVDDDFFALGGHSLLAVRAATRLGDAFGRSVPVGALFEAPTVGALARRLAEAPPEGAAPSLDRLSRDGDLPVSFAQERLWFLDRLDPGSAVYNMPLRLHLGGPLDRGALTAALRALVARHESLRTRLPERDGAPVQVVDAPAVAAAPALVDLSALPAARRAAELERLDRLEARCPFDLARGPLFRATLLRVAAPEHRLLLTLHHAVADGASLSILGRELGALYGAAAEGRRAGLAELPFGYVDFAGWQRLRLQGDAASSAVERAATRLTGAPRHLTLPTDRPRRAERRGRGALHAARLPAPVADAVAALGRRLGATPFMVLLSVFQVLLGRLSGQRDLLVGTPFDNRDREELAGVIGLFVNTLPVRADLAAEPTFGELVVRTRRAVLAAFAEREVPFERLVERLEPRRDTSRPPLVQTLFSFQGGRPEVALPGLETRLLEGDAGGARLELALAVVGGGDGLELLLERDADLFDATTGRRLLDAYRALAQAAVEAPETPWSRLPALLPVELRQVLRRQSEAAAGVEPLTLGPGSAEERRPAAGRPPATPLEEGIAGLWAAVLDGPSPPADADFFAAGGHSLLATRLLARIADAYGVELSVRDLFRAPTVEALARRVESALTGGAARPAPVPPAGDGPLPLSHAQERIWFLERLEPGTGAYAMPAALRLGGALDRGALDAALATVVERHAALRTTFREADDGRPRQHVAAAGSLPAPLVDLSGLGPRLRSRLAGALAAAEAERGFDPAAGPLARCLLLRLGPEEHRLLFNVHHVIADGWSLALLLDEVLAIYGALTAGGAMPPPPPALRYADHAAWERRRAAAGEDREHLDYWRRRLAGAPPRLDLPTDAPRGTAASHRGGRRTLRLDAALGGRLRAFGGHRGATPFMVLVAALDVVLSRLAGSDDVTVGFPIATRDRTELEGVVGIFLNTLPLRVSTAGTPGFGELIDRVRRAAVDAYAHRAVPFERILEEVQPHRDLGRTPLFQVFVNSLSFPRPSAPTAGLDVEVEPPPIVPAKFDLTLYIEEEGDALRCEAVYDAGLFSARRIDGLLAQLAAVLEQGLDAPDRPVAELDLRRGPAAEGLPDPALHLAPRWPGSVLQRLAAHAAGDPDRVAVRGARGSWSYGELTATSDALARRLRAAGVGDGELVAVHARRGAALVPALTAVLRAGAAFVLLDAGHPPAWRLARLRAVRPVAWLRAGVTEGEESAEDALAAWLDDAGLRYRLTVPAAPGEAVAGMLGGELPDPGSDTLAYAAFTSGSTGTPRAVLGDHGPLAHFLDWYAGSFDVGPRDRVSVLSGLVHDPLLRDLFVPLWLGATACVPRPEVLESATALAAWLRDEEVTVAHLTPSLGRVLAAAGGTPLRDLRYLVFGGEALTAADVAAARRYAPDARVVNVYGATETPQAIAWHPLPDGVPAAGTTIPLGRGIDGVQLLVLNAAGRPCGVGEVGEIHVRTPYLSRGYAGDPEATRERFLEDVFTAGDRLYRSGDLGRHLPGGAVEPLGRADRQLQVRGYRVEPAQIEAALAAHPAVTEAAVGGVGAADGGTALTAWVTGEADDGDLRRHLLTLLPSALVPTRFVALERLPRLASGKVDRGALPAPQRPSAEHVPPRGRLEEALARIFGEVLERDDVGAEGDFFALGGHSLLATRVVSRVRRDLGVELPLRAVFETPTVTALATRLRETAGGPAAPPLRPVPRPRELPLSFAQRRLWLLEQMDPGAATYVVPLALRLRGALRPSALALALRRAEERHEVLRTRYRVGADGPLQEVLPARSTLPRIDLSALPRSRRPAEARRVAAAEADRGFDLAAAPPLRCRLLRLAADDHVLLLTTHHVASDAWSLDILLRDLSALYAAADGGPPAGLPPHAVDYADFALWQRGWLRGEVLERELTYWRTRLAGVPPLELPTDRPRPPVQRHRGASRAVRLDAELVAAVETVGEARRATLFMTLLAGFAVLLGRLTGQDDFAVGTPVAGRTDGASEEIVGCFVNTLVLRFDLTSAGTFAALLERTRESTVGAYAHQHLPFERLVEAMGAPRALDRSPLFQVLFDFHNTPRSTPDLGDLEAVPFATGSRRARFDLALVLERRGDRVEGMLEYDRDLLRATTVERWIGHLEVLLAAAAAAPQRPLDELPLLTAAARQQVVAEWNDSHRDYERDATLDALFEARVARAPDAVAVSFGERSLTYAELDAAANRVAHWLLARGVGGDVLVALLVERSFDMIVAILGVLKAGAAYAPLEPGTPPERLRVQLADVAAPALLTQTDLVGEVEAAGGFDGPRLLLDRDDLGELPATSPRRRGHPLQLAYVNFTSGSTGRPKGVIVPHAGVLRLVRNTDYMRFRADDRILQLSTYAWDAATFEIWGALLNGGRLELVERRTLLEFGALVELIRERGITVVYLTTSLFNQVIEQAGEGLAGLRVLIVGGETASVPHFRRAVELLPETRVINEYGPSENTSFSSWHEVRRVPSRGALSIGRPLANSTVYVTDPELRPLPVGVTGELVLGGDGLARGYLGRPALTAERFVPNPFARGERLYRSGDLGRWDREGRLDFLGRIDFQVKIRGHRIEMGEVEEALKSHPWVGDAVVVLHEAAQGDKELVAYLAGPAEGRPEPRALRAFLADRLPDYMVPALFTFLDALPLSATGKVDRGALPAPQRSAAESSAAPRTPMQELVAAAFGELFEQRVGLKDDFFDLGGHSLLATRLAARLRDTVGVELAVRGVFEHPTVGGLATHLESLRSAGTKDGPELVARSLEGDLPLSSAQQRLWFVDRMQPGDPSYNLRVALALDGGLDAARLRRAFAGVVRRHAVLRATFHEVDGAPVQRVGPPPADGVALPRIDLAALPEGMRQGEVERLDRRWGRRPFDLRRGPLLRPALLRLAPRRAVLLLAVHHIVADGWSLGNLTRELAALYGGAAELPALPVQYPDYAAWESRLLAAGAADDDLAYWRRRLGGEPDDLRLPFDAAPDAGPRRAGYRPFSLDSATGRRLVEIAHGAGATPYMVLLAVWDAVLHLASGQERVRVGSPISTRDRRPLEELVGLFLNTLVLDVDLSGDPGFGELLGRVRRTTLEAYAHRRLPYQRLVDALGRRDGDGAPLYRVWFVLQNTPLAELSAPGLTLRMLPAQGTVTKFDLALNLVEGDDGGFEGRFEYDAGRFRPATVERLVGAFETVATTVAQRPEVRLSELERRVATARREAGDETRRRRREALGERLRRTRRRRSTSTVKGEDTS